MIDRIVTIADVRTFFSQLIREDLNFHPDTPFDDYINMHTGKETYTKQEAMIRSQLLVQCFNVCEREDIDIYELCIEIFQPM